MQYCSLHHQTLLISPVTSTAGYCFALAPSLLLSGVISPLISSSILGTWWSWEFLFWCPSILPFPTVHGVLKARILTWLAMPSPVDHILSGLSTMTCLSWVAPLAWLGFIELDKAVVLVLLDWLVFSEHGFSVSALWCPLATLTLLLGFLLPWHGVSLHGCSSKAQPLFLTLDEGYLLTAAVVDLQCGIAPLG